MSYIKKSISISGTDLDLVKAFVSQITAADSHITCDGIDESQWSGSNTPSFTLKIGDECKIVATRGMPAYSGTSGYYFNVIINEKTYLSSILSYCEGAPFAESIINRSWNFAIISNENTLLIIFGGLGISVPSSNATFSVITLKNNNAAVVSCNTGSNALGGSFYCVDTANKNTELKMFDRLKYHVDTGKIEMINSKAILTSDKTKFISYNSLCDCSNITEYSIISINGDDYYAVNANTLLKFKTGDE